MTQQVDSDERLNMALACESQDIAFHYIRVAIKLVKREIDVVYRDLSKTSKEALKREAYSDESSDEDSDEDSNQDGNFDLAKECYLSLEKPSDESYMVAGGSTSNKTFTKAGTSRNNGSFSKKKKKTSGRSNSSRTSS